MERSSNLFLSSILESWQIMANWSDVNACSSLNKMKIGWGEGRRCRPSETAPKVNPIIDFHSARLGFSSFCFVLLFDFIPLFAALVPFLPAGGLLCARALRDVASASAHNIFAFDAIALDVFFSLLLLLALKFIFADSTSPLSSIFQRNCTFPYVVFQLYRVAVRSNLSKFRTYPRSTRPSYRRLLYPMTENFRFFPLYFANFHPTWLGSGSAPVTYLSKTTFIQTLSTRILKIKYVLSSLRMHT